MIVTRVMINALISMFLHRLFIASPMNIAAATATNLWIVKIRVFKGFPELLSQIPESIVISRSNPDAVVLNWIVIIMSVLVPFSIKLTSV